jgi:hypothetical protein
VGCAEEDPARYYGANATSGLKAPMVSVVHHDQLSFRRMTPFERLGTGLAVMGIGITLVMGLPPPWWPDMPPALVRAGVFVGVALIILGAGLVLNSTWSAARQGRRRMLPLIGMAVFGLGFLGCAAWYFWPAKEMPAQTIAKLAELGWTVKPSDAEILFEVNARPLPPMKESASYFSEIKRPFRLQLQQVPSLDGLHFIADIPECKNIELGAGGFTDLSELSGFRHLESLAISQAPFQKTQGHLEKFLSPSRHESDSMTVRGHGRMERAGHGAEGLFRC